MFDDLKKDQAGGQTQASPSQAPRAINDDMFADVDPAPQTKPTPPPTPPMERASAVQSGKMRPISPNQNIKLPPISKPAPAPFAPPPQVASTTAPSMTAGRRMIIIFSVFILLLIVLGGAYYFFFYGKNQSPTDTNGNQNVNLNANTNQNSNLNNNQNFNTNQNSNTNSVIIDDSVLDDDFDGLTNDQEKEIGTNPYESDTDNDGVFDQDEVEAYKTNPLLDDSDADSLGDFEEVITYGTDPNDPDSDDDTYLDGVEVVNGYNPLGNGLLEDMPSLPPKNTNTNENNQ